uniref:Uncharacterized protein n=1 Tax=Oryza nivara TaxID=4536 RepID=A0A0E0HEM8_ORYNI
MGGGGRCVRHCGVRRARRAAAASRRPRGSPQPDRQGRLPAGRAGAASARAAGGRAARRRLERLAAPHCRRGLWPVGRLGAEPPSAETSVALMTTFTVHDLGTPGLKGILSIIHSFPLPEVCKVFSFSGVFGTGAFAVGTDVAFDTASGNFTKRALTTTRDWKRRRWQSVMVDIPATRLHLQDHYQSSPYCVKKKTGG